jgi:trimethylamine:corrinoid methyltransferase-like protein
MFARANDFAREILEKHEVIPLQDEVEAVITEVLAERADAHQ